LIASCPNSNAEVCTRILKVSKNPTNLQKEKLGFDLTQKRVTVKIILVGELNHNIVKFFGMGVVFVLKGELLFQGTKHFNFTTLVRLF